MCANLTMVTKYFVLVFAAFIGGSSCMLGPDPICPYPSDIITYLPFPSDCTKYIECYEGTRYNMSCPPNLFWNQYASTCDYTCNGTGTTPHVDPGCSATGISYLPNYADCTLFYQCVNGRKESLACPDGFAWSITDNACEQRNKVDCSYTTIIPPATTSSPDNGCPATGLSYLPNYADCTKYYKCLNGQKTPLACDDGTAWNIILSTCQNISLVDCSYTTVNPPTSTKKPDSGCPASGLAYLPDYGDCTKFYQCHNGVKTLISCPAGFAWSIVNGDCETQSAVDCSYTTGSSDVTTSLPPEPDSRCPATGLAYLPDYGDCTKFYQCYNGVKTLIHCPTGFAWSIVNGYCEIQSAVDCSYTTGSSDVTTSRPPGTTTTTAKPDDQCPATGVSYLPNYVDCTKYFQCLNGSKLPEVCPNGYAWNVIISTCESKELVDCSFTTAYAPTQTTKNNTCEGKPIGTLLPYPHNC